jgi:hypothetical protein
MRLQLSATPAAALSGIGSIHRVFLNDNARPK